MKLRRLIITFLPNGKTAEQQKNLIVTKGGNCEGKWGSAQRGRVMCLQAWRSCSY